MPQNIPKVFAITDRMVTGGLPGLLRCCELLVRNGIPAIMLREKDLSAQELLDIAEKLVEMASGSETKIIVNDRVDVAVAAGANGVHLGGASLTAKAARRVVPEGFLIGVSHHPGTDQVTDYEGADYVLASPVFAPTSKASSDTLIGIEGVSRFAKECPLPVIALGGITLDNGGEVAQSGVHGIAGIGCFMTSSEEDLCAAKLW